MATPRNVAELVVGMFALAGIIALVVYVFANGDSEDFASAVFIGMLVAIAIGGWRAGRGYATWGERLQAGVLAAMILIGVYAAVLVVVLAALFAYGSPDCPIHGDGPCHRINYVSHIAGALVLEILLGVVLAVVSTIRERGSRLTRPS